MCRFSQVPAATLVQCHKLCPSQNFIQIFVLFLSNCADRNGDRKTGRVECMLFCVVTAMVFQKHDKVIVGRFSNEMPAVAAAHVDDEVTAAVGVDQQVVSSTTGEPGQSSEEIVTGTVATGDIVQDERPVDEGKEPVDVSATRNQCQLPTCRVGFMLTL